MVIYFAYEKTEQYDIRYKRQKSQRCLITLLRCINTKHRLKGFGFYLKFK